MTDGYYRYPTIHDDVVLFVCEDDLWRVEASGGVARRLTAGRGNINFPLLSPDGSQVAFLSSEEGPSELFLMDAQGGPAHRLSHFGGRLLGPVGWDDLGRVLVSQYADQPFPGMATLHAIDPATGQDEALNLGRARAIAVAPDGTTVLGRNTGHPWRWKRYRGGMAGQLWIDQQGDRDFQPLLTLDGNLTNPMWLNGRVTFLSDHEGVSNLYSCLPDGSDLQRHTFHSDFYARDAQTDGQRVVYSAGADLYVYDPTSAETHPIAIEFHSSQTQRNRRYVTASRYLDSADLHPAGHSLAITTRGKAFTFANWEGAVTRHGREDDARYRLMTWLNDGKRLIAVTDLDGEEQFVILHADGSEPPELLTDLDIGRVSSIEVNSQRDEIAFSNHRYELHTLDLESKELVRVDRSAWFGIGGFDWSPDGSWLVYSVATSHTVFTLKLWDTVSAESHTITNPVLKDFEPVFDPDGRFIYFISERDFTPYHDALHFDYGFRFGRRPYLITLRADQPNPFEPTPRPPGQPNGSANPQPAPEPDPEPEPDPDEPESVQTESETEDSAETSVATTEAVEADAISAEEAPTDEEESTPPRLQIDLDGIADRVLPFPVGEGRYGSILGLRDNKVAYVVHPVSNPRDDDPPSGYLAVFDFKELEESPLISKVSGASLSRDGSSMLIWHRRRLRVVKAGARPDSNSDSTSRKSGWIDLSRVKVAIHPPHEWRQMLREAWRLQRDQFWTPDMSNVDWVAIYRRYSPLIERVASRTEFDDLLVEMQGELGTSHAYVRGGDYRPGPHFQQGFLGADLAYDAAQEAWVFERILDGDNWHARVGSPLRTTGIRVQAGDQLLAINGRPLSAEFSPAMALVNQGGERVQLTVQPAAQNGDLSDPVTVTIKALHSERSLRYRAWVNANRAAVHAATDGRIGYLHIPDMMPRGFAEFHRGYLAELGRDGLIVDVRYNGGGNVSPLLLEKLARRQIGFKVSRWTSQPEPYPRESVGGPMVALTNEHAGSDGDIFCHGFKRLQLGPLLGTRTWGGVIGIWPRHSLVDATSPTQPEYASWFDDVEWGVENYGVDPDIVVQNRPQDEALGRDPQLDRAIEEALSLLAAQPPLRPAFDNRPNRALPTLPDE